MTHPFRATVFISIVTIGLFLFGCQSSGNTGIGNALPEKILLQPFTDVDAKQVQLLAQDLNSYFPEITVLSPLPIYPEAWYEPRKRYRAQILLQELQKNLPENTRILGITAKDISVPKGEYPDWGIMGLAFRPGRAAVISLFRLDKKQVREQLLKVAVHELGHTYGLPHCPVKTCFMRDAAGANPLNEETGFCTVCSRHLRGNGWKLPL